MRIVYRDEQLVAIDKPAGLLVHPSRIARQETRCAMKLLRDQIGRHVYPVHRLDRPTSGVLLFALTPEIARRLGELFQHQAVHKTYVAVVRGYCPVQGVIDHPLQERLDPMTDGRARQDKPAQPAVTSFRRLATVELPVAVDRYPSSRYSLVEISPRSGRKHQIRRHFKHLAHPVIGDTSYGKSRHNRFFQVHLDCQRLLLAAIELEFEHPQTSVDCHILAPLGPVFSRLIDHLGWRDALPEQWLMPPESGARPREMR